MKSHTFSVTLTFADNVTEERDIKKIGENIAEGLHFIADTSGIAPENAETFTTKIVVSERGIIIKEINI